MFLILLGVVLVGAAVHVARMADRTTASASRMVLRWLLVGYCGVPMLVVAGVTLVHPHTVADFLGFPTGNPFEAFLGWAYLGMAVSATAALRFRGVYLIGPALIWTVFFAGATAVHLGAGHGAGGHGALLFILATHGLISLLLAVALAFSGLLRLRG